jgi:hypothetical protein
VQAVAKDINNQRCGLSAQLARMLVLLCAPSQPFGD